MTFMAGMFAAKFTSVTRFGISMRLNLFNNLFLLTLLVVLQPCTTSLRAQQSQPWTGQSNRYPQQQNMIPIGPNRQSGPGELGNYLVPSGSGQDYGLRPGSQFGGDSQQNAGWTNSPASSGSNPFFQSPNLTPQAGETPVQTEWPEFNRQMIDSLGALDNDEKDDTLKHLQGTNKKRIFETSGRVETIRQRYADGKVQVERQVTQDREGNYFSHGSWKLFSPDGKTLADGGFQYGMMEGPWERWHAASKEGVFAMQPFEQYEGPFLSTVNFNDGRMDGIWQIHDARRNKIMEIPYELGLRQGTATWWWPNGQKMREVRFDRNRIDGYWIEWNQAGQVQRRDEYIRGRKMVRETLEYTPGKPRYMAWFVDAKLVFDELDEWWEAKPAAYVATGEKTQHGPVALWYENGQPQMEGQFAAGERHGKFTWWHPNGQRQLVGEFDHGKKTGVWIWWHESGMKATEGTYLDDTPTGSWRWWNEDGQVTQSKTLGSDSGNSADSNPTSPKQPDTTGELPPGNMEDIGDSILNLESTPPAHQEQNDNSSTNGTPPTPAGTGPALLPGEKNDTSKQPESQPGTNDIGPPLEGGIPKSPAPPIEIDPEEIKAIESEFGQKQLPETDFKTPQ